LKYTSSERYWFSTSVKKIFSRHLSYKLIKG
jgi:hypothetical protein